MDITACLPPRLANRANAFAAQPAGRTQLFDRASYPYKKTVPILQSAKR